MDLKNLDRATILTMLVAIFERSVGATDVAVTEETNLKDEMKLDSIDYVAMALEAQSDFGIEVKNEDFFGIVTVGNLIDLIQAKLAAPPAEAPAALPAPKADDLLPPGSSEAA